MDAIGCIEVCIRTLFAYQIGCRYDTFGHAVCANFHPEFEHSRWLRKIEGEAERSKETFISHYRRHYHDFPTLPVWMATEVMSLGSLSVGYSGLKYEDRAIFSQEFDHHHKRLADWFRTLNYVRNVCSHHGRLWNRVLELTPRITPDDHWTPPATPRRDRVFYALLIIRDLLRKSGASNDWKERCDELLKPIANSRKWRLAMGMPENYLNHPVWR